MTVDVNGKVKPCPLFADDQWLARATFILFLRRFYRLRPKS